nr:hypothetical protein [Nocardioides sp.]
MQVIDSHLCGAVGNLRSSPEVDLGEVSDEVTHVPPGTRRDGRIKIGEPSGSSEELSFPLKSGDVAVDFHVVLPSAEDRP